MKKTILEARAWTFHPNTPNDLVGLYQIAFKAAEVGAIQALTQSLNALREERPRRPNGTSWADITDQHGLPLMGAALMNEDTPSKLTCCTLLLQRGALLNEKTLDAVQHQPVEVIQLFATHILTLRRSGQLSPRAFRKIMARYTP